MYNFFNSLILQKAVMNIRANSQNKSLNFMDTVIKVNIGIVSVNIVIILK